MKQAFLLYLLTVFFANSAFAQYYTNENKVWVYGQYAGLNFNSGSPVPFCSNMYTAEGTASVSDTSGNLLFFTNGRNVYNRYGDTMPNGADIVPYLTASTEQATVITPVIGTADKYYVFSLEQLAGGPAPSVAYAARLSYSMVDMSLDSGRGDLVTGTIGILMEDSLSESMFAVAGNNNNIWLVVHKRHESSFLAYDISISGIAAPIVSMGGMYTGLNCYNISCMKVSPNRRKILQSFCRVHENYYGVVLYNFNPTTGTVSVPLILDTPRISYGIAFSANSQKAYVADMLRNTVSQFDLSLPYAAITASKIIVSDSSLGDAHYIGDLKLAPDGKIYFRRSLSGIIDCINNPDNNGVACNSIHNAVPGTIPSCIGGVFPNEYVTTDTTNVIVVPPPPVTTITSLVQTHSGISISPNPVYGALNITAQQKITGLSIQNMMGMIVYNGAFDRPTITVDVSFLPPGLYIARANNLPPTRFLKQ